jgi:hypothetical protein
MMNGLKRVHIILVLAAIAVLPVSAELDAAAIGEAAGTEASLKPDGVVRIGWVRTDVDVEVDGMPFVPQAGLGSWAAFQETDDGAMVMGDTVVFQDEVDAAMDAAFANDLSVTALHNHFFYDEPKVYFMHIGGQGDPEDLATGVKAMWDAIKEVRQANPEPQRRFAGEIPAPGELEVSALDTIVGRKGVVNNGVVKYSVPRTGKMNGVEVGGSMGLSSWAAFQGGNDLCAMDGDFIMTAKEVQPVLKAMRQQNLHVVALHNHMTGDEPAFYFCHFWATGPVPDLAVAFRTVLGAQARVK